MLDKIKIHSYIEHKQVMINGILFPESSFNIVEERLEIFNYIDEIPKFTAVIILSNIQTISLLAIENKLIVIL